VALATAGNLALTAYGDNLRAWDLTTGTLRDSVRIAGGNVTAMALTDDGRRAVAGLMNGSIHLWDIEQRTVVDLPGHPEAIQALGVTPDGRRAVSISASFVKAWDLEALCEVSALQGPTYQGESWFDAAALALAPDGHTVYYGNPLMQWEIDQSAAVAVSVEGISGKILAVSADGGRAISKLDDKLLAVWDLPGQKRLLNLPLGSAAVAVIAMTPDGRKAITADFDHDLRFWDTSSAEILVAPNAQSEAEFVDFAGGKIAVFRLDNNRFRLWDLDGLAFLPDVGADNEWVQEALGSQRLKAQAHDLVDTQLRAVLVPPTIDETGAGELSYPKLL
jgi:WD40 repeat protein